MVVVWMLVAVALVALELASAGAFVAAFLALGAGAAAAGAAAGFDIAPQVGVAAVVSALGVGLLRPSIQRRLGMRSPENSVTGADLVGRYALTVDEVGDEHHPGHAMLGSERWLAVSAAPGPLPPQTPVVIGAVRGTTLIVYAAPNQGTESPVGISAG